MDLTPEDIAEIQRLLDSSGYAELTLETDRLRISLRRAANGMWTQEMQALAQPALASAEGTETADAASPAGQAERTTADGLINIFPPLPGTFYRAPKPGAAPFVEMGSDVTEDMVIGIIETMKLMNPARARAAGTIVEICAVNGALVEESSVLMRVRPSEGGKP